MEKNLTFALMLAASVLLFANGCGGGNQPPQLDVTSQRYPISLPALAIPGCGNGCGGDTFCASVMGGTTCAQPCTPPPPSPPPSPTGTNCLDSGCCIQTIVNDGLEKGVVRFGLVKYASCNFLSNDKCESYKDPNGNFLCKTVRVSTPSCYGTGTGGCSSFAECNRCTPYSTPETCSAVANCAWNDGVACTDAKDPLCGGLSESDCASTTGCMSQGGLYFQCIRVGITGMTF